MGERNGRKSTDGARLSCVPEGEAMAKTETERAGAPAHEADAAEGAAYGCLFCITGKEQSVVESLQALCPGVRAITMRNIRYRTCPRVKRTEEVIVLPSYVFFRAPSYIEPAKDFPRDNLVRVLRVDGDWRLSGPDEQFVRWTFRYDGLLSLSTAYCENERVKIVSGPLKDKEGRIQRVNKRGLSGQVLLSFNGRSIPVWLGFELITPLAQAGRDAAARNDRVRLNDE